jgi:transglutaminase-like putative cysteine protease
MTMRWQGLLLLLIFLSACDDLASGSNLADDIPSTGSAVGSQSYTIHQTITLSNEGNQQPDQQNLWVALIRDVDPYQTVQSRTISPENYVIVNDEYDNQYAEFDFKDHPAGTRIVVEIEYRVTIYEQIVEPGKCEGALPNEFTQPELHIESANPQIVKLSKELSQGQNNVCDQVHAFYDYVGDELIYTFNQKDWGAQAALGYMGSDCTEYSSLMIALSRAAGIPARYYEGLLYLGDKLEGVAQTEHAWLDVYFPGVGWAAMDPTLGRSLIDRTRYFAHYTPDHIIVTVGRNPSTLRGASYWSHLYWPGDSTTIRVESAEWILTPIQ